MGYNDTNTVYVPLLDTLELWKVDFATIAKINFFLKAHSK